VQEGLRLEQKELPPKYFYDDVGARLFDAICDTPEYYPTRTEHALLEQVSDEVIRRTAPSHLVELGSGASRKTRVLLDALTGRRPNACYVPLDVSDAMLRSSAAALRRAYPKLRIHGIVADYDRHLRHFPPAERRLVAFLGSTIGNFSPADGITFLRNLNDHLRERDFLLIGLDLVKPVEVLNAAYNDRQGITAEFNRNVLRVINRELQATFRLELFEHLAFYREDAAQIEMHLRATTAHEVHVAALDLTVSFAAGETIRTEISRKFDRGSGDALLRGAGFEPAQWFVSPDGYFALVLAGVARRS
jgi:L-histidine N-alpha-methyltransferase